MPRKSSKSKATSKATSKDQKRLVRARMQKTGERYTAARAVIVARGKREGGDVPRDAVPRGEWPTLAGMGDTAVKAKTGRTWAGWVSVLDAVDAHRMSHRDIARHLVAEHGLGGWWSQTVTVGYERIRGLRDVGQSRDGGFEAGKSRTYPVPVATLFGMFNDARARRRWLPSGWKRVRTSIANKSLRVDWQDGTQVNLDFVPKGAGKCTVAVQHAKLASKAAIGGVKAFWSDRLDALGEALR